MEKRKVTDRLPFLNGKIFTNTKPSSPKYRTTGNTYLCIIPVKISEGNSSIKINGETHFFTAGEPCYLGPTDIYEFCGPCTVSMVFCSPNYFAGEEEIIN
jgi:hypothetical protein